MNQYFAALPPEEIGSKLVEKVNNYYQEIERNGRLTLWRKSYRAYYALNEYGVHQASEIKKGGERNELHLLKANHYRNLLNHLHVFVTQQRPSFECRAVNTDYKSQVQTILGENVLDYYLREKRLADHYSRTAELCLVFGDAYFLLEWDGAAGEDFAGDIETNEVIKTGDVVARIYSPLDMIRQCRGDSDTKQDWYITRTFKSKYDLAAEYPDHSREIFAASDDCDSLKYSLQPENLFTDDDKQDTITVFKLYHDRTPACSDGREVLFLGDGTVLDYREELSYHEVPIYRMAAYNQHDTSFGYTVGFDLLAVQDAADRLYSIVLSNQSTFGVQNIWMKPGTKLTPNQLAGGFNLLESQDKPEAINLTNTPAEIFNFLRQIEQLGEVLSGVNSVARGQPEASLKSGAALALVASQAVQFSNGIQAAYIRLLEDTGTALLKILQSRAALPRTAVIAGKNNRAYSKSFTGDDLTSINRVIVDVGNPVSRTVAGRMNMADQLLQAQMIKRPEQYIQVLETGRLDPVLDDERAEILLVQRENEDLREGKEVPVTAIDMHVMHIKNHRAVLADPDARRDPKLVQNALSHIYEHIQALRTTDPALLNVLGMAPIAVGTPPQGANAPQPPGNQPQEANPTQVPAPPNSTPQVAAAMPQVPNNTPPEMMPGNLPLAQ